MFSIVRRRTEMSIVFARCHLSPTTSFFLTLRGLLWLSRTPAFGQFGFLGAVSFALVEVSRDHPPPWSWEQLNLSDRQFAFVYAKWLYLITRTSIPTFASVPSILFIFLGPEPSAMSSQAWHSWAAELTRPIAFAARHSALIVCCIFGLSRTHLLSDHLSQFAWMWAYAFAFIQ